MNLHQVLTQIRQYSTNLCENFELFNDRLEEVFVSSEENLEETQDVDFKSLYNDLQQSRMHEMTQARALIQNQQEHLQAKQESVKILISKREKLKEDVRHFQKNYGKLQKDIQNYEEKLRELQRVKDCIKTYKLLISTNFAYKKGTISGYIKLEFPPHFKVFDFNSSSGENISNQIWSLMENITNKYSNN